MIDRQHPPLQKEFRFQVPISPLYKLLDNCLPLYIFQNQQIDLLHFFLRIKAGSLFETQKLLAAATYSLLMESVPNQSVSDIEDWLDFHGSAFSAFVNLEYVTLQFIIPKSNCTQVLPFILQFIIHPVYKDSELELYKQKAIKDLQYNKQKVAFRATQFMYHSLLDDTRFPSAILEPHHIECLNIKVLQEYHKQTFTIENLSVFVAGNIDAPLQNFVEQSFENLHVYANQKCRKSIEQGIAGFTRNGESRFIYEHKQESLQSAIILCKSLQHVSIEEHRKIAVLRTLLGGYFGSRLMQSLREKHGLTYSVYASSVDIENDMLLYIDTEVKAEQTDEAILYAKKELLRLINEKMEEEELSVVKSYMTGSLLRRLDGTIDYAKEFMYWKAANLDEREAVEFFRQIKQINTQQIQELAVNYLQPNSFNTIVVGNTNSNML